jgi:hypothetical protein
VIAWQRVLPIKGRVLGRKHISYDTSLENVSSSLTGLDPYRTIHFTTPQAYTMFPDEAEALNYLKGVEAAMADGYPEIFILVLPNIKIVLICKSIKH